MGSTILSRIKSIAPLSGNLEFLPEDQVHPTFEILRNKFLLNPGSGSSLSVLDGTELSSEQLKKYLRNLPVDKNSNVLVIWASYRSAVLIPYSLLVENYDELWFPSADDVFVTDKEMNWLLVIDHEEIFSFYSLK